MPNAAEVRALGDLLSLYAGNASTRQPMPPMWTPCSSYHHSLWALPAKTAAVAAAGHRQRLCSAVERAYPPAQVFATQRNSLRSFAFAVAGGTTGPTCQRSSSAGQARQRTALAATALAQGFNQSELLCRPLARWLGCDWDSRTISRVRATATQHHLSARLRKRNLKNAFRLELPVQGLHMVIVDDVVTTGSTVAEIAQLLLRNGAATVQVWCLCRTL